MIKIFFIQTKCAFMANHTTATYSYQYRYSYNNSLEEQDYAYLYMDEIAEHVIEKLTDMFSSIRFSQHSNYYFSFEDEADHAHFILWSNDLDWDVGFICPN
jgi:hypothetical protein